jgi:hypothetical protein
MAQASSGWVTAMSATQSDNTSFEYSPTSVCKRQAIGTIRALSQDGARVGPNESPVESDNTSITSSELNDHSNEMPSSIADTRVGPAPKFDHELLQQSLQGEQLCALKTLIAHQEFSRKKLCTCGSYLRQAHMQVQELHAHAESLSGHLKRELLDTIQDITDDDARTRALAASFSTEVGTPRVNLYPWKSLTITTTTTTHLHPIPFSLY